MGLSSPSTTNTALVTGASSGIGAHIARQLGERGWHVTLVARREEQLAEVAADVASAGGSSTIRPTDLVDTTARSGLIGDLAGADRTVDVVVNNAGWSTLGAVHAGDAEAELSMVALNIGAVVHLCTAFLPGMVERGAGGVLNVASTAAFQPVPGQAGYGGSKAFVLSYSQAVRAELAGTGVNMTVLCPGPVETGFEEAAGFSKGEAEGALPSFMWVPAEQVAKDAIKGLEAGRMVVIPGAANRVTSVFGPLIPKTALLPLIARNSPGLRRHTG